MAKATNWVTVSESSFPWEREALEFIRSQFPDHEPYRAWANFEFESRLDRSVKDGAFLALVVAKKHYQLEISELGRRYDLDVIHLEGVFIDALRDVAIIAKVDRDLVFRTNTTAGEGDWNKLLMLVGRAMPAVKARLTQSDRTIPMIYTELLARYDQMPLLQRLRDRVGVPGDIPDLWLLIPGDTAAVIDEKAIPVISVTQRVCSPEGWLANRHRCKQDSLQVGLNSSNSGR